MFTLTKETGSPEMRKALYAALDELMNEDRRIFVLEADLGAASGSTIIQKSHPDRYLNVGIAEANMIGIAAGLSLKGYTSFCHTFSPFAARRALDQIFLEGAYAGNTMNIYASDPGVCAETNGGTHTTFEDMAVMRAIPGIEIYDPADAVQLTWLIKELAKRKGVHYIRCARKGMPQIYEEGSTFEIGRGNILREGKDVLIVACGLGVHLALQAAQELAGKGTDACVVDLFTVAPLDKKLLEELLPGKKAVITVENHSITGGLGSAVAEITACLDIPEKPVLRRIGVVDRFGQVGSRDFLMKDYGLTVEAVIEAAGAGRLSKS